MNSWSFLVLLVLCVAVPAYDDPTKSRLLIVQQSEHGDSSMSNSDSSGYREEQGALLKRNHQESTSTKPNRFHRSTVTKLQLVTLTILVPDVISVPFCNDIYVELQQHCISAHRNRLLLHHLHHHQSVSQAGFRHPQHRRHQNPNQKCLPNDHRDGAQVLRDHHYR